MRQNRKLPTLILGMVTAGSLLAGCSGTATPAGAPSLSDERGPITVAAGKDEVIAARISEWNAGHPDEKVTFVELPSGADNQRQQMIQNANTKSDAFTVLEMDVTWTAEFAANRWVDALPAGEFPLAQMLPQTVATARYRDQLYAVPSNSDAGLLYYRTDLLEAAGIGSPPTTYGELKRACDKILDLPQAKGLSCYAGQFEKYEGLTVNATEAINAAGGTVIKDGQVSIDSAEAAKGLGVLVDWYKDGTIPRDAITYKEEQSRASFVEGKSVFLRNWPYVYDSASATDGSSSVAGKFAAAPLPGFDGPGASTLGGKNYGVSAFAKNKGTAKDFIKWFTGEESQRQNLIEASQAPTFAALYDDKELVAKYPYLAQLKTAIENASPRPQAVRYGDVSAAIQSRAYSALTGQSTVEAALKALQNDLTPLMAK